MSNRPPRPPPSVDKGWAWVVAIAIFFERFFTVGVTRSAGIFLQQFVERYHVTTTYAGLSMTLAFFIFAIGAPVTTVLGEHLTPQRLFILGGFLSAGAIAASSLVTHLPTTIVMMGLGIGVVNSCSYGNGMVMIGKYFRAQRQMVTHMALTGASIGQIVFPLVIEYLLGSYGLKGALLISGGLYLQCAVAGALLRPIDVKYQRVGDDHDDNDEVPNSQTVKDGEKGDENSHTQQLCGRTSNGGARYYKKLRSEKRLKTTEASHFQADLSPPDQPSPINGGQGRGPGPSSSSTENQIHQHVNVPEIIIQNEKDEMFTLPPTVDDWRNVLYGGNRGNSRLTVETSRRGKDDASGKLSLKNGRRASFSGSIEDKILPSTCSSLSTSRTDCYLSDTVDDDEEDSASDGSDKSRRRSSIRIIREQLESNPQATIPKWRSFFKLVFDFSVLKNGVTLLYIFVTFLFYLVWYNFVLLIPGIVSEKGVDGIDKPVMISMIGVGDLVARVAIATGSVCCCVDNNNSSGSVQRYKLQATAALLGGVNIVLFIPVSSFPQLIVHSFLHGLFGGVFECLLPGVLTDFVGVAKIAQTVGVVLLFQGAGGAVGQPLLGFLKNWTGSFLVVCAVCSISLLVSCFLLFIYPAVRGKD